MLTASRLAASLLILFSVFCLPLRAQERQPESRSTPIVTAALTAEGLRFTAASNTTAMRLEVYTADGQRLFDSGFKLGSVLDWAVLDEQGQRYPEGAYLCVVSVKSLSGKVSRRTGTLYITPEKAATLEPVESEQLSAAQLQALGGAENNSALTVMHDGEPAASTTIANTGSDGEINRSRGALSFRLGDFFSGKDREQMRLTEEGNLGIGTARPRARLDVNGVIRAREGIEFGDGTLLNLSPQGGLRVTLPSGKTQPVDVMTANISGTGTTGALPIWTDGAGGALGDSSIFEAGGRIGIGTLTPNPNSVLHLNKSWNNGTALFVTNNSTGNAALVTMRAGLDPNNYAVDYASFNILSANWTPGSAGAFLKGKSVLIEGNGSNFGIGNYNNTEPIIFYTTSDRLERMRIKADGNVGIGTTDPTFKLHAISATNQGLRVQTNTSGGAVASFGGFGDFRIDAPGVVGGRFTVQENGNVGIGTSSPLAKLDVVGDLKLNGINNGIIFPDGSKMTTATTGGGSTPSGTNIINAINNAATTGTIDDAHLPNNLARLSANTFNGNQSVNGNVSATGTLSAGGPVSGSAGIFTNSVTTGGLTADTNTLFVDAANDRVGIGTTAPQSKLSVAGAVQSTTGGFQFPDGTVQTSAVGKTYTTTANSELSISPSGTSFNSVLHLDLPPGTYLLFATINLTNYTDNLFQDNKRFATCSIPSQSGTFRLGGNNDYASYAVMDLHSVASFSQNTTVDVRCGVPNGSAGPNEVRANNRRLTAIKIGDVVTQ